MGFRTIGDFGSHREIAGTIVLIVDNERFNFARWELGWNSQGDRVEDFGMILYSNWGAVRRFAGHVSEAPNPEVRHHARSRASIGLAMKPASVEALNREGFIEKTRSGGNPLQDLPLLDVISNLRNFRFQFFEVQGKEKAPFTPAS